MEVKEITVLTYRDGPQVQIPPGLIQAGRRWPEMVKGESQPSHHCQADLGSYAGLQNCEEHQV